MSTQVPGLRVPTSTLPSEARHCAEFHPTLWGNYFLTHVSDMTIDTTIQEQHEALKEEVRKMIMAKDTQKGVLKLIDAVQRLGVAHHYEKEIKDVLIKIFQDLVTNDIDDDDLYAVSLRFRLLRQQGIKISCDEFNMFKDEEGFLKESLRKDVQGMLSLYEASYLAIPGEEILDEATAFTMTRLQSVAPHVCPNLAQQINHALYCPLRKAPPRTKARDYLDIYAKDDLCSQTLIKFAKLDFNIVQAEHQNEIRELTRWWRDLDLTTNLQYTRDRLVESYVWMMGLYFEPKYAFGRNLLTKILYIITVIDDTFDAYGMFEELQLFMEAVKRWDIGAIDILPEYMKIIYKTLLDIQNEIEEQLAKDGKLQCAYYAKKKLVEMIELYLAQAKWLNEGYIPTMEEYMSVASISLGTHMVVMYSFLGMGDLTTEGACKWLDTNPKILTAASMVGRLLDDIVGHEDEQKRGHNPSAVECYMKQHNVSKEEAVKVLNQEVRNRWKDINQEFLMNSTTVPFPLLERILNSARAGEYMYKDGERFTNSYLIKDEIASLLKDPVIL